MMATRYTFRVKEQLGPVLAPWIDGLGYDDRIELALNPAEIALTEPGRE